MSKHRFIVIASLVFIAMVVGFMPYSALVMFVPGFLIAVFGTIAWVWGTAYVRAAAALGRSAPQSAKAEGGEVMTSSFGKLELALVGFSGMLIGLEVGAILIGLGPYFTLITLAYFMVIGGGYVVYRRASLEAAETSEAEARTAAWPGVTMGDEYLAVRLSDLLRDLSDQQAERVFRIASWHNLPSGTNLAAAGASAEWIYVLADGAVQLSGRSSLGEVTVRIARGGEAFPLAALIGAGELVTSAKAATDVSVLAIPRAGLLDLCVERPDIGMAIFRATAEILGERYRSTLRRHLDGAEQAMRQPEVWANV